MFVTSPRRAAFERACRNMPFGAEIKIAGRFRATIQKTLAGKSHLFVLILIGAASLHSYAQAPRNLITQPVNETQLATLRGNMHPAALPENDQGTVDDSTPLEHVIMVLKRAPEQQQALTALIDQLHNPNSPAYHQWLTPEEFGKQFGPSDSDLATLTHWMESHGFTVEQVAPGRNLMIFSGNAGQVREAFHTELHHYLVNGEPHYANRTEPQVPAALAPAIAGFRSLNDFRLKPLHHDAGVAQHNMKTGTWEKVSGPTSAPDLTFTNEGEQFFFVSPQDFYTIYNENPLFSATPPIDGHGVTIAVIEETNVTNTSDVTSFRQQFGLPTYPATPNSTEGGVNWMIGPGNGCSPVGITSTGEEAEALLDVEWAGAAAPKAVIDFVACSGSNGIDLAAQYVTNYLSSTVVSTSLSYGECEIGGGSSGATFYLNEWEQEAAEGITAVVSSGDSGSLGCDQGLPSAKHNLSVNEIADTPYNISAGGTDFSDLYQAGNYSAYWNTANSTVPNGSSALSYIPEIAWGSYCASPLTASFFQALGTTVFGSTYTPEGICNSTEADPSNHDLVAPLGGGGGVSAYNSLPTWQSVYGVGLAGNQTSTTMRNQPDVSFFASNGWWGHALVYCQSDTGHPCNYSNTSNDPNAYALAGGGTSFVAPQINGMMALIAQKTGSRQGVANYTLYNLGTLEYGTPTTPDNTSLANCSGSGQAGTLVGAGCIFRDIAGDTPNPWQGGTLTSNIVQPCVYSSVSNCYRSLSTDTYGLSSVGSYPATYSPAYPTSQGYDAATGLGSPNIANVVNNWNNATPSFASTTTIAANPTGILATASTTLTATVTATGRGETSTGGPPAVGTVSFYLGGAGGTLLGTGTLTQACTGTAPGNLVCPPSTATLSVPGTSLATGANSIVAYFPGDGANDAPSTSSPITVILEAPAGPVAGVSPPSLTFGSQNTGTTSGSQPVTLSNTGGAALIVTSIVASANFGTSLNCVGSIAASGSCTISVTFSPTATGTLTGSLTITDNNGGVTGATQTVSLTGTGINPGAGLSATSVAFSSQVINTTSTAKTVTVTSTGTTSLSIPTITITGANASDFAATNNCTASMAPAAKCTITLTYTPSVLGAETATLNVADNASSSPQRVALTGTGIAPVTLSVTSLSFGSVGENSPSAAKNITLTNNQAVGSTISSLTFIGTNAGDFGETNTCNGSVAAKSSCTISITFTPSILGAETASLSVSDGASNSPQTAALTGTGILPATLSATSLAFGNVGENSPSAAKSITFYNYEAQTLTVSITTSNPDFALTNTCGGSVAAASHCTITVTFTPSIIGAETGTLTVTDAASNSPQTAALTGTGVLPATLSVTSLAFGNVGENSPSAAKSITFYNYEAQALSVSIATSNPDFALTNTCGGSVAAAGHCTITVTFTPSIIGTETGTLTVTDTASNSPQTVALTGTGILPATFSATSIAFGNVGENSPSAAKSITFYNYETQALTVSIATSNPDFAQTNTCGGSVAAAGHCTITVTFTPSIIGAETGTLTVTDAASNSPQTAALTGTGVLPASLSAASLAFGNVGENSPSAAKSITFYNYETQALTVSIATSNPDFAQTNTCGEGSVAAAGHCTITVTFTPSIIGAETGTLTVTDAASNSPQTVALTGTGVVPAYLSVTSFAFGNVTESSPSAAKTITLYNNEAQALAVSIATSNPDFAETNTCGGSVAAAGHCTITVTFTPSIIGVETATLSVTDAASNSPQTASLSGTGIAQAMSSPPSLSPRALEAGIPFGSGAPGATTPTLLGNGTISSLAVTLALAADPKTFDFSNSGMDGSVTSRHVAAWAPVAVPGKREIPELCT